MKTNFLVILIFSINVALGQNNSSCRKEIENGKFILIDSLLGNTIIKRRSGIQIETGKKSRLKVKLKLEWIDDCKYSLQLIKVLKNPNKLWLPPNVKDIILNVEILSISKDSYLEITSSNVIDKTEKRTILIK